MGTTGNQATIGFATSNFAAAFIELGEVEQDGGEIDDSHLGTSQIATKIPQDLHEPGEMTGRFIFDPEDDPPPMHQVENITITYPLKTAGNTPASLAGTGFIKSRTFPNLQNNQLNEGVAVVQWDGKTGPTFTKETTP